MFVMVAVIPGLGESKVFLATDWLVTNAPWTALGSGEPVNRGVSDTIDSATPMLILLADAARHGSFAAWDPFNSGGVGLGAFPNSGILSPLSLPWWVLPPQAASAGVKVLEVASLALGFQLLLRRRWHLPLFTVPLATLVFASSGFMIAWTNWPQTRVAALIPLLFWAIECLAVKGRWHHAVALGIIFASMLLGGFPAVTAYAAVTGAIYFFVRTLASRQGPRAFVRACLRCVGGVSLGILLSAVHTLPFLWWTQNYVDFDARAEVYGDTLPLSTFASAASPFLLGPPDWSYGAWPVHFVEGFSYVGATTFVLIAVALLVKRRTPFPRGVVLFFAAVFVLLTVAMYFHGPVFEVIHSLPGISSNRICRMRSIAGFAAAVLAALGAAALHQPTGLRTAIGSRPRKAGQLLLLGCRIAMLATIAGFLVWATTAAHALVSDHRGRLWILLTLAMLAVCGLAALAVWIKPARLTAGLAVAIMIVTTAVPATYVAHRWWPLSDSETFYPESAVHAALRESLGMNRYASVGWTMVPGTSSAFQLRSLTGHGFSSPEWHEVMSLIEPSFFQTATWSTIHSTELAGALTSPILDRFGVSYVVCSVGDCGEDRPGGRFIAGEESLSATRIDDSVLIARASALDRIRWASTETIVPNPQKRLEVLNDPQTSGSTVVLERKEDAHDLLGTASAQVLPKDVDTDTIEISVTSDGPGWVVIADPMRSNGWTATLDGRPAELVPAEHAAVAVFVPGAGEHTIELGYVGPNFTIGLVISMLTVGSLMTAYSILAGLWIRARLRAGRR